MSMAAKFRSEGFTRLFGMFAKELDDEYLGIVEDHLRRLEFRDGVLMSAELGKGNKGTNYVLRKPRDTKTELDGAASGLDGRSFVSDRSGYVYRDRRSR